MSLRAQSRCFFTTNQTLFFYNKRDMRSFLPYKHLQHHPPAADPFWTDARSSKIIPTVAHSYFIPSKQRMSDVGNAVIRHAPCVFFHLFPHCLTRFQFPGASRTEVPKTYKHGCPITDTPPTLIFAIMDTSPRSNLTLDSPSMLRSTWVDDVLIEIT